MTSFSDDFSRCAGAGPAWSYHDEDYDPFAGPKPESETGELPESP